MIGNNCHRKSLLSLGCAVALALVISLAYVKWLSPFALDDHTQPILEHNPGISGRGLKTDEFEYLSIAKSISVGSGYGLVPGEPTAIRVPGYPLFVAALFRVFGSSLNVALLGNAFLVALLPVFSFALARAAFGCKTAVIAAFFCALDPGLYYFVLNEGMSEALFAVLLCAGIVMWQKAQLPHPCERWGTDRTLISAAQRQNVSGDRVSFLFTLAAGILLGAASLTRTGFLALPVFILLTEFVVRRRKLTLRNAAALCLAFVLIQCPWALRNRIVMGGFTFSSTNDGRTLLGSMLAAQQHRGNWHNPDFATPEYAKVGEMPNGIERNRAETLLALAVMKKISPVTFIEVAVRRVFRLWVPLNRIVNDETGFKANLAVNLFYFPAMLLAAFGLWRARYNSAIVPLWTVFLYITLLAAISWGGTRFRYPVEPFLAVFAAHGLLEARKLSTSLLGGRFASAKGFHLL